MRHLFITTLIVLFTSTVFANGDDIIKSWRNKQEAYFKGEALVQSNSVKAAEKLSALLNKYDWKKQEKAKMMHKLAELYLGIGRVNETQKSIKTDINTKKSLNLFKKIIKEHPRYDKLEYILFSYGFELFMRGNHKESYKTLSTLNNKFPRSEFTIDAIVIRADSKFELRQYKKSIKLYQIAINSRNLELATYSAYRKAWAQFNSNMFNVAYRSLVNVINDKYKADKRIINSQKEARNDLARFYQKQVNLFNPYTDIKSLVGKNKVEKTLAQLADLYFESGQWKKAIHTYGELINNFKNSENISLYHLNKGIALSTRKNIYKASKQISLGLDKCDNETCKVIANDKIFTLVNSWEKHWRKHQNNKGYSSGLKTVYPKLANIAANNVEKSKIYLLLAEVEIYLRQYKAASTSYERAYLSNKKASYANEAFWESINSLTKLKLTNWNKKSIKRLEELTSSYISAFPSSKRSIETQNFLAKVYIANNKTKSATDLYRHLSHKHMYNKAGIHAYNNYIKSKLKESDYKDITQYLLDFKKKDKKKARWKIVNADLDKAYEDWSQLNIKKKKYSLGIRVLKEALKNRPVSSLASEWKWNLAYTYLANKDYKYAADNFIQYEAKYKNRNKKQITALNNALISYKHVKYYKKAILASERLISSDRKNRDEWLLEKANLLNLRKQYIDAFKTLSRVDSRNSSKNPLFLEIIKPLNKKQVKQVLSSNLNGFSNESIAETVVKLISTINDIDDKATKTAAVSLTNIRSNDKNYAAKGHYIIGMHEMRKFAKRQYSISSKLDRSLDKIIRKVMTIDGSFRKSIENSNDTTQPKALIAMGNLYNLVAKKYQPYSKKRLKSKVSILSVKDLLEPFFAQSKVYWKEAQRSIYSIKNKKDKSKLQALLKKSVRASSSLEKWYVKNSNIQFISQNGAK